VYGGGKEVALEPGYAVFVPRMEEHQSSNTGDEVLRFVCLIAWMGQG
jgi:mannose-6-phosphate isomerase-like protein (cupin superfamily)